MGVLREAKPWRRGEWQGRPLSGWLLAFCSLAACGPPHTEHPLEARARRVVVACPKELVERGELHEFASAICSAHCPKAIGRERLAGCFHVFMYNRDDLQRLAPGAQALMACEYVEAE